MNIEKFGSFQRKSTRQENFFSDIVARIFSICKTDSSFHLKENIQNVEANQKELYKKIAKQDELLEKSVIIKNNLSKKISNLKDQNDDVKSSLLERLGSEL